MADKVQVLYVDDEVALLEVCKLFLEMKGEFSVTTETSAARALVTLKKTRYDAVISDYQMPGMDGIEFLRQLRAEHPTLPFIIFTGRGREEIVIAAFENGADFYLQKGGDPDSQFAELSHKIRRSVAQRKAEHTLVENENRFRALIQNTTDIIRILNKDGMIVYDSPAAARSLGYPPGHFIGKNPLDFIHPDDRDKVTEALGEVLDRKNPGTPTEFRIHTSDGGYIDVESTSMNLFGVEGVDGIVVTTRIITDRKRAQLTLEQSEKNYRDLYDNAPNAYYTIGMDGRIVQCNRRAGELLGIPQESLIGKKISRFYADTESGKTKARQLFTAFREGKEIADEELQMQRADGTVIWIGLTVNAIRDDSGRITGSRTIVTDITQRRALADELRKKNETLAESRRVLDTLIHNLPGMMYRCRNDPGWTMEFISDGCEAITGYTANALLESHLVSYGSLVFSDDRQHVWDTVQGGITSKKPFQMVYRILDKEGKIRVVWEKGRGVFDDTGALVAIEGYVSDITGYEQAEEKLRESEEKFRTPC